MIEHTLFVRALHARHGNNMRRALTGSAFPAVTWMLLDRHHIDADTIPDDVVATIAKECDLTEPTVRAYLRLSPCNVGGQPQRMTPLAWEAAVEAGEFSENRRDGG